MGVVFCNEFCPVGISDVDTLRKLPQELVGEGNNLSDEEGVRWVLKLLVLTQMDELQQHISKCLRNVRIKW